MSDALLPYYDRELIAIRQLAAEFAETHPKIASRLRLSAGSVDDPHVERLLEGVAFLAARVHHRLDDDFPELTDALLGVLYPHYLAPTPSCAIARFTCQPDILVPMRLPSGLELDSEPVRGESCRFQTAYAVTLWPIEIDNVQLSGLPLAAPNNPLAAGAIAVLRISLSTVRPTVTFTQLGIDSLRVFVRGPGNVPFRLYELLCANAISVALADSAVDPAPIILGRETIEPIGFASSEALLPWPARSFSGFRLLTEYFAFPEKFLFLEFKGLDAKTLLAAGNRLEIFVYLNRAAPELERAIDENALVLGCTPIVNLFRQACEPIALSHTELEYRIIPDVRRPAALEVWGVDRVRETRPDGTHRPWRPFYRLTEHDREAGASAGYYSTARRDSGSLGGTELYLTPYDPEFDARAPADAVLSVDATCLNRDLPGELPFGGGHPALRLVEGSTAIAQIACLTAPTGTLRAPVRERSFWRLVSHLSLGHLSVVGGEDGAAALREILRLYDLRDLPQTRGAIAGLVGVHAAPGTARVPGSHLGAFCRGLDVTLEFDQQAWQASGLYLLASVLDRFLALHTTVNSFVRTRVVLRGSPERVAQWPARAGAQVLL